MQHAKQGLRLPLKIQNRQELRVEIATGKTKGCTFVALNDLTDIIGTQFPFGARHTARAMVVSG